MTGSLPSGYSSADEICWRFLNYPFSTEECTCMPDIYAVRITSHCTTLVQATCSTASLAESHTTEAINTEPYCWRTHFLSSGPVRECMEQKRAYGGRQDG